MVSRIGVTLDTATLPAGTVLADLQAEPVTPPFKPVPFTPAAANVSKAAAGTLPFTGDWNVSFTLVTGSKPENCPLPSQNVTCMPTFVDDGDKGCKCPPGMLHDKINGLCVKPKTACEAATFQPNTTQLTDNATLSLGFSDGRDPSQVVVLMRPKVAVRNASASSPSTLLGLGQVVPGLYEIELA